MSTLEVIESGTRPTLDDAFAHGLHAFCVRHGLDDRSGPIAADAHPLVRVVLVRDTEGALVGGGRIHQRHPERGFPAQSSLRHFVDARTHVKSLGADAIEIVDLWATPLAQRSGIPRLVAQACLAAAQKLGKRTAFTISHDRFDPVLRAVGMTPALGIAEVPFPTPSYRSRIYTTDLAKLAGATKHDRTVITTIADGLTVGGAMPLHELASIEHGCPSWTVRRRTTTRMPRVA